MSYNAQGSFTLLKNLTGFMSCHHNLFASVLIDHYCTLIAGWFNACSWVTHIHLFSNISFCFLLYINVWVTTHHRLLPCDHKLIPGC